MNITDLQGFLTFPLIDNSWFWGQIMLGLFLVFTGILYFEERQRKGSANFMSAAAVGSITTIVLSAVGSLLGIISSLVLTVILTLGGLIIFVWFISKD